MGQILSGKSLVEVIQLLPEAAMLGVMGVRNGRPSHQRLPKAECLALASRLPFHGTVTKSGVLRTIICSDPGRDVTVAGFRQETNFQAGLKPGRTGKLYTREFAAKSEARHQAIRSCRESEAAGSHTESEWQELLARFGRKCLRCGALEQITKDHITPIVDGGSNLISNLQPLCRSCNSWKADREIDFRNSSQFEHLLSARA